MLSCKDVCAHAIQAHEQKMRWQERWQLVFHLLMCGNCRNAMRQIQLMINTTRKRGSKEPTSEQVERWLWEIEREQMRQRSEEE